MQARQTFSQTLTKLSTTLSSRLRGRGPASAAKQPSDTARYESYRPLALWSDSLFALGTDTKTNLGAQELAHLRDADELAQAAALLASGEQADQSQPIALFLPSDDFVSTLVPLPGLTASAARQALLLQADGLIPSLEEPLVLVQRPALVPGSESYLCLWMRAERLDSLSQAFDDQGLVLAAVAPRALLCEADAPNLRLSERDEETLTTAVFSGGTLVQWLTTRIADLNDPEFAQQWQAELKAAELSNAAETKEQSSSQWYRLPSARLAAQRVLASGYYLRTASEMRRRSAATTQRVLKLVGAAMAALVVLALLPFVLQSVQFRLAARELHALRAQNDTARQNQAYVADFESTWGEVNDFPRQDSVEVMYQLQRLIAPDTLTALEIEEGLISIEGRSANPQAILQRLEQDPLFTEVVFARATNNSRYYINLRLTTVSFEGYRARYLDEAR